eukprot:TRINITY_DN30321_c0_g1_i1.p1 TRINITY_DN30321_c0_g1~~TRINITY_DN30321_c0_g1_i1.p1  ORF type:complete len:229 (+),score=37.21 TRINITY_DN30321_c0_g1_i1:245-931(+)
MAALASSMAVSVVPRCLSHTLKRAAPLSLQTASSLTNISSLRAFCPANIASVKSCKAAARGRTMTTRATISVGDTLPDADLSYFDKEGNLTTVSTSQLTKGKKVVLFAVPGAFTPTCSQKHLPGFIEMADELKAKGIDTVACVAVNDPFVMRAWGESVGADEKVLLLADGSCKLTTAMGVELDLADKGLGLRSRRYSLLADNGVVKQLNLEEGGAFTVSGPEEILKAL